MNSMFFNKVKSNENENADIIKEISAIDVSEIVEHPGFVAGVCGLSGSKVLMLKNSDFVNAESTKVAKTDERLQPFYNQQKVGSAQVEGQPFIGFSAEPNKTFGMQQNCVRTAKYVYFQLLQLSNSVNTLINHAPNQQIKNTLINVRQELFVLNTVMLNIIKTLGNTAAPNIVELSKHKNSAFCVELNNATTIARNLGWGLFRLNKQVNIAPISRQILFLTIATQNIAGVLNNAKNFC